MIAYAFTDPGRASIFGISKLGTLAILLVPILALAASAYGFFRLAQGHHSLASPPLRLPATPGHGALVQFHS